MYQNLAAGAANNVTNQPSLFEAMLLRDCKRVDEREQSDQVAATVTEAWFGSSGLNAGAGVVGWAALILQATESPDEAIVGGVTAGGLGRSAVGHRNPQ